MSSLSWFLYLADVFNSLGAALVIFSGLCFMAGVCLTGTATGFKFFLATACCVAVAVFIPSKTTMYAIAASEFGQKMLDTNVANKASKALDAWLDKQLEKK